MPSKLILVVLFFVTLPVQSNNGATNLLPTAYTNILHLTWRQDGRLAEIEVTNPKGKWVVTSLLVVAHFQPESISDDQSQTQPEVSKKMQVIDFTSTPKTYTLNLEIQPGKSERAQLELKSKEIIERLFIVEARGREQSRLERVRGYLW